MRHTHLVTLTYRNGADFKWEHVGAWVRAYRAWCRSKNVLPSDAWVCEQGQCRNTHFHVAVSLPSGLVALTEMSQWWPHGYVQVLKCADAFQHVLQRVGAEVSP